MPQRQINIMFMPRVLNSYLNYCDYVDDFVVVAIRVAIVQAVACRFVIIVTATVITLVFILFAMTGRLIRIWVVVNIRVPFWVTIIIRHLIFRVPKRGP